MSQLSAPVRTILLASASPRRREILESAGFRFRLVEAPGVEETFEGRPGVLARRNARTKARAAAALDPGPGVILGADTVVAVGGETLGKPGDREEARAMLEKLSGGWHRVVTGICLRHEDGREVLASTATRVHFTRLAPEFVEAYLSTGEADDKAGAYGIQGQIGQFVDRISGCYFNVVGLSPASVRIALERLGEAAGDYLAWPRDG